MWALGAPLRSLPSYLEFGVCFGLPFDSAIALGGSKTCITHSRGKILIIHKVKDTMCCIAQSAKSNELVNAVALVPDGTFTTAGIGPVLLLALAEASG